MQQPSGSSGIIATYRGTLFPQSLLKNISFRRAIPASSSIVDNIDEPIPPGWEIKYTADRKKYYVDHNTKTTQWERPDMPLPPGWEQRQDCNGKVYYMDHNTRTTTWQRPTPESIRTYNAWQSQHFRVMQQCQQRFLVANSPVCPTISDGLENLSIADLNHPPAASSGPIFPSTSNQVKQDGLLINPSRSFTSSKSSNSIQTSGKLSFGINVSYFFYFLLSIF